MAAYLVLMHQVDDIDRYRTYQPVREIRFGITSRGQAVVVPEFAAEP